MVFSRSNRRQFIKTTGAAVTVGSIAGCTGGDGGGDGSDGGGDGSGGDGGSDGSGGGGDGGGGSTTTTTVDPSQMDVDEWRTYASEKAAEELESGPLTYVRSSIDPQVQENILDRQFSGPYEVLTGNLEPIVPGNTTQLRQRYTRMMAAGNQGMDFLDSVRLAPLVTEGVPFTDLTTVPSYREAPEFAKAPPYRAASRIGAYGQAYNTNIISNPPTTWDEILELPGDQIGVDYTPTAIGVGYVMEIAKSEDYVQALGDNEPIMYDSNRTMIRSCGQGEIGLGFLAGIGPVFDNRDSDGLPIEPVGSPEMWVFYQRDMAISARPERPWAAKLFMDARMNPDNVDMQISQFGSISYDGTQSNPAEFIELFGGEVWRQDDFETTSAERISRFQELIGAPVA